MLRRFIIFCSAAFVTLGLGPLAAGVSARGRSFPIEVTGTINRVDTASQTFTMQTDEPAKIVAIGLRWDCKFKSDGALSGPHILRKSAYVKVRYFATIFTGNLAVEIEVNPKAELVHGVIERIEPSNRLLTLRLHRSRCFVVRWAANARFIYRGRTMTSAKLREGSVV